MTRTVYSEIRGKIVDWGKVGNRVQRAPAKDGTTLPYVEIDQSEPVTPQERTGWDSRAFEVRLYQQRGTSRNPTLWQEVRALFDRQRWTYYLDDANTALGVLTTRTTSYDFTDTPADGVAYDTVTVVVQTPSNQP